MEEIIIETFTEVGTTNWTVPNNITNIEYLVVGGGGGGGGSYDTGSGGGGGGGMVLTGNLSVNPGDLLEVTVGAGGIAGYGDRENANPNTPSDYSGGSGGNSVLGTITALGGGGGLKSREVVLGTSFGIGGSSQVDDTTAPTGGNGGGSMSYNGSGGGGGADGNGGNGANKGLGGTAGSGIYSNISGTNIEYGKGGIGARNYGNYNGTNGTANTGQGGNGSVATSFDNSNGGTGGSGIVIIKYTKITNANFNLIKDITTKQNKINITNRLELGQNLKIYINDIETDIDNNNNVLLNLGSNRVYYSFDNGLTKIYNKFYFVKGYDNTIGKLFMDY
jgi:hypothetical protein